MKKISLRKVIISVLVGVVLAILSFTLFRSNEEEKEPTINKGSSSMYTEEYFADLMSSAKTIELNRLDFAFDSSTYTATFKGFKETGSLSDPSSLQYYGRFLNIPETVRGSDGKDYTVTKVDISATDPTDVYVRMYVTGVRIPKTVTYINPQAFYGYGAIEYFETPFVGTTRGSSATGRIYPLDATKFSSPFVSMFSLPDVDPFVGDTYDSTCATDDIISVGTFWYESDQNYVKTYQVPGNLRKVVITDETYLGNRALFNLNMVYFIEVTKSADSLYPGLTIGDSVFAESSSIESIILPQDNTSLQGITVFGHLSSLKSIKLPALLTSIPEATFESCISLKEVLIPSSVAEIGAGAFHNCSSLTTIKQFNNTWDDLLSSNETREINLPNGLEIIHKDAFSNCLELTDIVVPNSVQFIGQGVFAGCGKLTTLSLPFIGAHRGTAHLTGICQSASLDSSVNFHSTFGYIFGLTGSTDVFYDATQNYSSSGSASFYIPKKLKSITITDETAVSTGSLQNLKNVETIIINSTVTSIAKGALNGCAGLKVLNIPFAGSAASSNSHVGYIFGTASYTGATASRGYYVPNSLKSITISNQPALNSGMFYDLLFVESITIKEATTWIDSSTFHNTPQLKSLTVPFVGAERGEFSRSWWWWRDEAYRNTLSWIFSSTYHVGTYSDKTLAWYGSYIKYIPTSLTDVIVTDDTKITTYGFRNFSALENITITGATYISEGAMAGCSNLKELNVPFIGKDKNTQALQGREYTIGWFFGGGPYTNSYEANQHSTFHIPSGLSAITINGNIPIIGAQSFRNMTSLRAVYINSIIDTLGANAFENCKNLSSVETPNARYTTVGNSAFRNCINLYNINAVIPSTVTNLGHYAFAGTSVGGPTYPLDFTRFDVIGNYAFSECPLIEDVALTSNITNLGEGVFQDCSYLKSANVNNCYDITKNLFKNCYNLTAIDISKFDVIPEGIFSGCINLKSKSTGVDGLVISNRTSSIGKNAFENCASLEQFTLYATVNSIGSGAFKGCTGLEYMTIPKEVVTIQPNGWDGCDPNFFFYVYEKEEDWPTGWVNNWNCYYPVYIIGHVDDSLFTYVYDSNEKGYFITGVNDGVVLEGQVKLPSYHDGLRVVGLSADGTWDESINAYKNSLKTQTKITSVIIPSSVKNIEENTFKTGSRVDLYFEHTKAQAASINLIKSVDKSSTSFFVESDESKIISGGLVFYKNDWTYQNITASSQVPHVNASSLEFTLDFGYSVPTYTGYQITPNSVSSIKLPAVVVKNTQAKVNEFTAIIDADSFKGSTYTTSKYYGQNYIDMFSYTYQDNIKAGTATMKATLNESRYKEYQKALEYGKQNVIYISGTGQANFEIKKATLDIYLNNFEEDINKYGCTSFTHEYDQKVWKNNVWDSNNILGLEEFSNAVFYGTIATRRETVGTYYFNSYDSGQFARGDFEWLSDYRIMRNGVNITDNFDIYLYLYVEIVPMKVVVDWTGGSWTSDGLYYQYPYQGATLIEPQARILRYDSYNGVVTDTIINYCDYIVGNITQGTYPSTTSTYEGYVYLRDNKNFELVYADGTHVEKDFLPSGTYIEYVKLEYYIVKGTIEITVDLTYTIPSNKDYWEYQFGSGALPSGIKVKGLGEESVLKGILRSSGSEEGIYRYTDDPTAVGKVIRWEDSVGPDLIGNDVIRTFHIYREMTNPAGDTIYLDERDYYDIVITSNTCVVKIEHNDFDVDYFISLLDGTNATPVSYVLNVDSTTNRESLTVTFAVDGKDYMFYPEVADRSSIVNLSIIYQYNSGVSTSLPLTFKEIGEYVLAVTIEGKNYHTYYATITLNVIKSDVTLASSLNKEYDRKPHNGFDYLIKKGDDQDVTFTYYSAADTSYSTPIAAPVEIGRYVVLVQADETDYFNGINRYIPFEITKRKIVIDLSGGIDIFDETITGTKVYDGNPQLFTPNNDKLLAIGYLLGEETIDGVFYEKDVFYGQLSTAGQNVGTYDNTMVYWPISWYVYSDSGINHTANYQVEIIGEFEITPLSFGIVENHYSDNFDYMYHSATVTVTTVDSTPYTIYYSLSKFPSKITDFSGYSTINYTFCDPGSYMVYYAVVAPNYITHKGVLTIDINELLIEYHDPCWDIITPTDDDMTYVTDYTGDYQEFVITVTDPWYATVYYSLDGRNWTTIPYALRDFGSMQIYYKIEALYYTTVYSATSTGTVNPITFKIDDSDLPELDASYTAVGTIVTYDGNSYGPSVITPSGFSGYILYSLDAATWSNAPFEFTSVGTYTEHVRIKVPGYKTKTITVNIVINPVLFTGISVNNYDGVYDGEEHTVTLNGILSREETVLNPDATTSTYTVLYYVHPTLGEIPVTVEYTSNINVVNAGYGYLDYVGYKDIGIYKIYVRVSAPNFEDLILGVDDPNEGVVKITYNDNPFFDYTYTEIEYSKAPIDVDLLQINTVHDGTRSFKFWKADSIGSCDFMDQVYGPEELGYYCFQVTYYGTKNCVAMIKEYYYFKIIHRVIEVTWEESFEYDGLAHSPNVRFETGTSDLIGAFYERQDGSTDAPVEVGTYVFNISMIGSNPNYILPFSTVSMEIYKRKLEIVFIDEKEYDGTTYYKDNGWDVLNLPLLRNHKFEATMETNRYIRSTYFYSTLTTDVFSNSVNVVWDIYLVDNDGNYVFDGSGNKISVKDYYDYSVYVEILIRNPYIDLSGLENTVIPYDGWEHTVDVKSKLPHILDGATVLYKDTISSNYVLTPIYYIMAGVYSIDIKITKAGYADTCKTVTLEITKANLNINIEQLYADGSGYEIYDSTAKQIKYTVDNIRPTAIDIMDGNSSSDQGHVRYYPVDSISLEDLEAFYASFDETDSTFSLGLNEMVNAGKYYAVVYYADTTYQWHESYAISEVEVVKKDINVDFSYPINVVKTYDGEKVTIPLAGATADSTDLITGHNLNAPLASKFIRTNSANAGVYDPATGFEFGEMVIVDKYGQDVSTNYHPVVSSNVHVTIKKAYLTADQFYVNDLEREYDGTIAAPEIYCESDGARQFEFQTYDEFGNLVPCTPINAQYNVGIYYVSVWIDEGTNYYASTQINPATGAALPLLYAEVNITPKEVSVEWDDLVQDFNGEEKTASAKFLDVFGNYIALDVFYYDRELNIVDGFTAAGNYAAYATFDPSSSTYAEDSLNYTLTNDFAEFKIAKAKYTIVIGNAANSYTKIVFNSESKWSMKVNNSNVEDESSFVTFTGLGGVGDAILRTNSNMPGNYSGNALFDLSGVRVYSNFEDVTNSIEFMIKGTVVIKSNKIEYEFKDLTGDEAIVYTGITYRFSSIGCLQLLNIAFERCIISYEVNGETITTDEPTFRDVGTYVVRFQITDSKEELTSVSGQVTIEIVPAKAFVEISEISKEYDGTAVSVSTSSVYGFNGANTNDLIYTYYYYDPSGTIVELGEAPIDAGNYMVKVTCEETLINANGLFNYEKLEMYKDFAIYPKTIIYEFHKDITVTNTDLTSVYDSGIIEELALADLSSGNRLTLQIRSVANKVRTIYTAAKVFTYTALVTDPAYPSQTEKFIAQARNNNEYEFTFTWVIEDLTRTSDDGNFLNISNNYKVSLDFRLYIHYQLITGVVIEGYDGPYDGLSHSGTVDLSGINVTTGVIQKYSQDYSNFIGGSGLVYTAINNPNLCYTEPGEYPVYYQLTASEYEPYEGVFYIRIGLVERQNFTITSSLIKKYDTNPMFTRLFGGFGNDFYLPDFSYDLVDGLSDYYDKSQVSIVYQKNGSGSLINPSAGCVNAGQYTFTLVIPQSNHYKETVYTGVFTIDTRNIIIRDKATKNIITYTGSTITYSNFGSSSAYDVLYLNDDGTTSPIPSDYEVSGILLTNKQVVGTYQGINNTLTWFRGVTVLVGGENQTDNFKVTIDEASLIIDKANIDYLDITTSVPYDGNRHGINILMIKPLVYKKLEYYDQVNDKWTTDYTNFQFIEVGEHPVKVKIIADNYNDAILDTKVIITKARPTASIDVDMSKEYDGREVLLPEKISTTNIEANDMKYRIYEYYEEEFDVVSGTYRFVPMSRFTWDEFNNKWYEEVYSPTTVRPINVGRYKVIVYIKETENFEQCYAEQTFTISGHGVDIMWGGTTFTYDGTSQTPEAYLPVVGADVVPLVYTVNTVTGGDVDHKTVGIYSVSVEIDPAYPYKDNYIINPTSSYTTFSIVKREVSITLRVTRKYFAATTYEFEDITAGHAGGYTSYGLATNHYFGGSLNLINPAMGVYTELTTHGTKFVWSNAHGETLDYVIYDEFANDVASNYNVSYNINVKIDSVSIEISVSDYVGIYDGDYHGITVTILNIDVADFMIEYSHDGSPLTTTNPTFKAAGAYAVYYKVTRISFTDDYVDGYAYVTINKENANLELDDPYVILDKVYDAVAVVNPLALYTCDVLGTSLKYSYYKDRIVDPTHLLSSALEAGEYRLVIEIDGLTANYEYTPIVIDFEITKRDITVEVTGAEKLYDKAYWLYSVSESDVTNIVSGHKFSGAIQSTSENVGVYRSFGSDLSWQTPFEIYYATGLGNVDVSANYNVLYNVRAEIKPCKITVEITPYIGLYDGSPHTLVDVKVVDSIIDGVTYPKPDSFTVYYSEDASSYTTTEIFRTIVGIQPVYVKIEATNYETYLVLDPMTEGSYIEIQGIPFGTPEGPDGPGDPDDPDGPITLDPNVIFDNDFIFSGLNYPTPYYESCPSSGAQTVVYYTLADYKANKDDLTKATALTSIKDAGSYVFVLNIASDGVYEEKNIKQTITIKQRDVTLIWEDLSLEYTGSNLSPKAYYTRLPDDTGATVYCTLTNVPQILVGSYSVYASTADTNYNITNDNETFEITPKLIKQLALDPNLSVEFGDELVIVDTDGNIIIIDEFGVITSVVDAMGNPAGDYDIPSEYKIYIDSDTSADVGGTKHKITVVLDDKSNCIWDVNGDSNDLIFDFEIKPMSLPNDEYDLEIIYDNVQYYTGEDIEPPVVVNMINKIDGTSTELRHGIDVSVAYADNREVTTATNKAKILLTGINNYTFSITKEFIIYATDPLLLTISADAKIQFITVDYDEFTTGVSIKEDGVQPERTTDNCATENFYLGHIYQETYVSDFIKYFDNNKDYIQVFKNMADYTSNTPINKDDYSGVSVGTGYVIVLYKDATCTVQIDMIECILYGDLNGDGSIDGGDIQIVAKVNKSTADIRNSTSLSIPDMEYIDNVYYYAGIVDRSYGVIDGAALQALAKFNKSQEHSDFNESYYVSPSSLVSSE